MAYLLRKRQYQLKIVKNKKRKLIEEMIEDREYEGIEYFLFEQSHDYQHKDENWKDLVSEEVVANG